MSALSLITSLNKEGKSPVEIARELHSRGVATDRGKAITPHMVVGFLRFVSISPGELPAMESVTGAVWGSRVATAEAKSIKPDDPALTDKKRKNRRNPTKYFSESQAAEITRLYQKESLSSGAIAKKLNLPYRRVNPFCAHLSGLSVPPGEVVEYIDDEGRTVMKCPPGWARGAYPQRNVGSKGGS